MSTVSKSYESSSDPVIAYCTKLTVKLSDLQSELMASTLKNARLSMMLGAPEVLQAGANFIRLIKAKKALDVGTFTGASALAWALALPEDGKVVSMDVDHTELDNIGLPVINKCPQTKAKIDFRKAPALETLDQLIADGQSGTFDFAFIDADKENYSNYYDKCMQLLRSGGVILIDNALWSGSVVREEKNASTQAIHNCNERVSNDPKSDNMLFNTGDGLHIAFKL